MALSLAAQAGISAAPTALKFLKEKIDPSRPSAYEKQLSRFMELYQGQAEQPVTENRVFKSGKREIDARDKKNREQVANVVGAGNVTNEVKLAGMQDANENYGSALNRVISNAQLFKEYSQGRVLNLAGMQEQAKQNRVAQDQQNTAAWLNPLSKAANAFVTADAFGEGKSNNVGGGSDSDLLEDEFGKAPGNFTWGN